MSYYLEVPHFSQRFITVDIPAPTDNAGYDFEIEFECQLTATDLILNGTTSATSNNICFLKASVLEYRNSPNSAINMTHGVNAQQWHVYRLRFTGSGQGNIAFYVDGDFKSNYTPSASIATPAFTALLHLSSSTRTGNFRYFKFTDFNNSASNRMYDARAHLPGDVVLRETANGQDGSFSANGSAWAALPPVFVADVPVTTPISFTGNIADQVFTVGDSVNVDLSSNWSGTQTPFTYALASGSLAGTGLSLSSAGVLSGTATEATQTGLVITGTDADTNTAVSNSFSVTVNAAPTGSNVSISDTLPALDSSLSLTYEAPAGVGTITISDWANNTATPLVSITDITVNVRSLVDGSTVYRTTTASVDAGSDCIVSDVTIVTGTQYEVTALKHNGVDYDIGIAIITAT